MPMLESLLLSAALLAPPQGAPDPSVPSIGPPRVAGAHATPVVADTLFNLGRFHGFQDAQEASIRGDFLRGFGWSLVLGPLGGILAVRRSSSAAVPLPEGQAGIFLELGAAYRDGYRSGFETFFSPRRREATIAGSMVGSLAFGFVLLRVVDLPSRSRFRGDFPDPEPTFILFSIPLGR